MQSPVGGSADVTVRFLLMFRTERDASQASVAANQQPDGAGVEEPGES